MVRSLNFSFSYMSSQHKTLRGFINAVISDLGVVNLCRSIVTCVTVTVLLRQIKASAISYKY